MCDESKGITARWASAKQRVAVANAKLVLMTSKIHTAIKAECGQVADETTFEHGGWKIFLGRSNRGNEPQWLIYVIMPTHAGQISSRCNVADHWNITLRQCEDLADAFEDIEAADIRLAIESKLAES